MCAQEELLDIKQAAQFLGVSETSLRRWTTSGRLACLRVGQKRERRFRRSDLIGFMEDQPGLAKGGKALGVEDPEVIVGGIPLRLGTHFCGIYSTDEGRVRQAVAFLADGLRSDTVCFVVAETATRRLILDRLGAGYFSLPAMIDDGYLVPSSYAATVAEQIGYWESRFLAALSRGARSLRVVGDLRGGRLMGESPVSLTLEYEREYERLIARRFPVVTLCQYNVDLISGADFRELYRCHPDNFAYPIERLID